MQKELVVSMKGVNKVYSMGEFSFQALYNVDFKVYNGDYVAILGPSGSGKSTLMNIIGCLDVKSDGDYHLSNIPIENLTEGELADIRNKKIGFVFQSFQLLQKMTALDNVMLPLIYGGYSLKERREMATAMLEKVGLKDKMNSRPNQLSGGQQQRISIARALVTNPAIILADEPTGALDQKTGEQIIELFEELNNNGKTIIMITHNREIAERAKKVVNILDGKLSTVREVI